MLLWSARSRLKIGMYLGLVIAPVWFGGSLARYLEESGLRKNGKWTEAKVEEFWLPAKQGGTHRVLVIYETEGGPRLEKALEVTKAEYDRAKKTSSIRVQYLPSNPQLARAGKSWKSDKEGLILGGLMTVICGGAVIWMRMSRQSPKSARS